MSCAWAAASCPQPPPLTAAYLSMLCVLRQGGSVMPLAVKESAISAHTACNWDKEVEDSVIEHQHLGAHSLSGGVEESASQHQSGMEDSFSCSQFWVEGASRSDMASSGRLGRNGLCWVGPVPISLPSRSLPPPSPARWG